MFEKNRLNELLGTSVPILQAPMAGASNPDLVAAVSNAGGLGALGAAAHSPDALRKAIQAIRQQSDAPFNINLFHKSTEVFDADAAPSESMKQLLRGYHAEQELGDQFDLRAFHDRVVGFGSITLPMLHVSILAWIEEQKATG